MILIIQVITEKLRRGLQTVEEYRNMKETKSRAKLPDIEEENVID